MNTKVLILPGWHNSGPAHWQSLCGQGSGLAAGLFSVMIDAHHAPAQVERVKVMLANTPVEGYVANCAAVRDMDQRSGLAQIAVPTLVIGGKFDQATPPEHGELIAR